MVRQASTVADLWMSNTKSGFFIKLTQNLRNKLRIMSSLHHNE